MSDRTERPGAREGKRGLQSVVQLYLSRPPKREIAWPDQAAVSEGEAQREAERGTPPFVDTGSAELSHADVESAVETSFEATFRTRPNDPVSDLRERLDARIDAVTAIPFDDIDVEEREAEEKDDEGTFAERVASALPVGARHMEAPDADDVTVELVDDDEPEENFETAPEPVLSGITLDLEEPDDGVRDVGPYDAFAEIVSATIDRESPEFGADEDDIFSEDALPTQEIGAEALRAELAFKLEEHLDVAHGQELESPRDEPRHETEIFFEEDADTTEIPIEAVPGRSIEEIFDLVDRSPALGPSGVLDVPAIPAVEAREAEAREAVDWEILPEEEPERAAPADAWTGPVRPSTPLDVPLGPLEPSMATFDTVLAASDVAERPLEPDSDTALGAPRVALFLSTLPPRLRRRTLDCLAAPLVAAGRRVLFLEPDPTDDDAGNLIEEALGLDTAVWRRSLGASPREILLMRPAQREQLFGALAAEERRSELVLLGVGLPESIFCPRMLPLVDTIVVGLTRQESSLYEAYRALRGLPERRPGFSPYAVTIASSAEEATRLLERFRQIAKDFLRMPVLDGGWLELAAMPQATSGPGVAGAAPPDERTEASRYGIDPALLDLLASGHGETDDPPGNGPGPSDPDRSHDGRPERAFFERLADWFGPNSRH